MARGQGRKNATPGTFGSVDKLPSGRYRAMYKGPDGRRHKAPLTFTAKQDARGWLALQQADIIKKSWMPPEAAPKVEVTFEDYANNWLSGRMVKGRPLKARTRDHYRDLLDDRLFPTFGKLPIGSITSEDVEKWHAQQGRSTPTFTAHAYSLLNTIMKSAMKDSRHLVTRNPCVITGAGSAKRVKRIKPASLEELAVIVESMPDAYKTMVILAAWCALRFGELTALTRADVVLEADENGKLIAGSVYIERGAVYARKEEAAEEEVGAKEEADAKGERKTETPKSEAGYRPVEIPPHLLDTVSAHLSDYVAPGGGALLFPAINGGFLASGTFSRWYVKARHAAKRDDLRFHDLRHTGAVLAASTGATLAELMNRLGHSSPAAALRYQHVVDGRDREVARMLSKLVAGDSN